MPATATVILNPSAGTGRDAHAELTSAFAAAGVAATIETAAGVAIAMRAKQAVAAGANLVIAAGGDGTVSAVASAVAGHRTLLGVIPVGTLNHFAKDLGIPLDLAGAVGAIAAGKSAQLDVGEVNGRLFVNNSSLGVYPRLVYERQSQQREGHSHALALALAAMRVWRQYRRVRVTVFENGTERVVSTPFVFVGNNEYRLQGISFGGRSTLAGGYLHVCMAPNMTRAGVMRVLMAALVGHLESLQQFESLRLTDLSVDARRSHLPVSIDGEIVTLNTPLRYRIHPRALSVIVPA